MKISRRTGYGLTLLSMVLLASAGCSHSSTEAMSPEASQQASVQQNDSRIQAIQNNPNMPPEAKQKAIAQIKSQQASSAASQAAGGATTPAAP